jgi:hypothetical protein
MLFAYERRLCATSGHSITAHYANGQESEGRSSISRCNLSLVCLGALIPVMQQRIRLVDRVHPSHARGHQPPKSRNYFKF